MILLLFLSHPMSLLFVICYFLFVYMHYGTTFVVEFIFFCLICLQTSMLFCSILYDSGSYLVILRTDL